MGEQPYLHGYSAREQARLLEQADFLAQWVFQDLELPTSGTLLEVGAGVGAETRHLLRRGVPRIIALERDARQLAALTSLLGDDIRAARVLPVRADAGRMPLASGSVDQAFVCWVMEHVPEPPRVLKELCRVLAPGGRASFTEVQNQSLTVLPPDATLARYWAAVNQAQLSLGGDPFIGARLPGLLHRAGFERIESTFVPVHGDARDPARRQEILTYFRELLRSAIPAVKQVGLAWEGMESAVDAAYDRWLSNDDAVSLYTFARVIAHAPGLR